MHAIKRGCLELLIIWALAGYGLYTFFHGRFEPPGDQWGAVIGGMLIAMAEGALRNAFVALGRRKLLFAAKNGQRPEDGKLSAAAGKVTPLGQALKSPFEQEACVVYGYEIITDKMVKYGSGSDSHTDREKKSYMGGYAMCPFAIRTPIENVKILGFAIPDAFPKRLFDGPKIKNKVLAYMGSTKFEERKGLGIGGILAELKGVLSEESGARRYDWKSSSAADVLDDPDCRVEEQFVPVGAEACAIGTYSAQKGGLINDYATGGLELMRGSLDDAIRSLRGRAIGCFVLAIFFAAAGSAGAYGVLTAREGRSSEVVGLHQDRYRAGVRADDLAAVQTALDHGVNPNSTDGNMEESIGQIKSKPMLELLMKHGLDLSHRMKNGYTPLLYAVALKKRELALWMIAAGADVNAREEGWNTSALERALDSKDEVLARALMSRGAHATYVTAATGRAIDPAHSAELDAINAYLHAFNAGDTDGLRAVTDAWPEDFFDSFSRGLYKGTRLCLPTFQSGYANPSEATAVMSCPARGRDEVWTFTLVKRGTAWKVRREAWSGY